LSPEKIETCWVLPLHLLRPVFALAKLTLLYRLPFFVVLHHVPKMESVHMVAHRHTNLFVTAQQKNNSLKQQVARNIL
jgi:hypothetical protein